MSTTIESKVVDLVEEMRSAVVELPAQPFIPQQDLGWMICFTCNRAPEDCPCARHVECSRCGIDQQDVKYMNAGGEFYLCTESPDGLHVFVSVDKEP